MIESIPTPLIIGGLIVLAANIITMITPNKKDDGVAAKLTKQFLDVLAGNILYNKNQTELKRKLSTDEIKSRLPLLFLVIVLPALMHTQGCGLKLKTPEQIQAAQVISKIAARNIGAKIAGTDQAEDVRWICERILEIPTTADADDAYIGVLATTLFQYLELDSTLRADLRDIMSLFDFKVHEDTAMYLMRLQDIAGAILKGMDVSGGINYGN